MKQWVPFWKRASPTEPIVLQAETTDRKVVELFWLYVWNRHDRVDLASMILEQYKSLRWKGLVLLDQNFRNHSFYYYSYDLRGNDPEKLIDSRCGEEFRVVFLCLCTLAPNGFFREKALLAIEQFKTATTLPFVLLRLNDWVDQVRGRAKRLLGLAMNPENALLFVASYGLVERARRSERNVNIDLCERIDELLRTSGRVTYEVLSTQCVDAKSRNQLVLRVVLAANEDSEALNRIYRLEKEPFLKLHILKHLLVVLGKNTPESYVELLRIKSSQKCAILLFEKIAEFDFKKIEPVVSELVFSTAASIRKAARELIQLHKKISFSEVYATSLRSGHLPHISITGLGEVGTVDDLPELTGYLKSKIPRLRKLALIAIARLSPVTIEPDIVTYLSDEDSSVSNAARSIQSRNRTSVDLDKLEKAFLGATGDTTKANCLRVLTSTSKWDAVYYILKYRGSSDKTRDLCERQLSLWNLEYNRSFVRPTSTQVSKLNSLIQAIPRERFDNRIEGLVFALKGFMKKES